MSSSKVFFVSLGCPKNRVDSEIMLGELGQRDYEVVETKEEADVLVVNTCSFIEEARETQVAERAGEAAGSGGGKEAEAGRERGRGVVRLSRIDGGGHLRFLIQIVLPIARPAIMTVTLLSFIAGWNAFLWPLIVLNRSEVYTLLVGLNAFQGELDVQWHYILAMTVVTLIPVTLVFAFLQRFITTGIASSGMK